MTSTMSPRLLLLSSSRIIENKTYLDYARQHIVDFLNNHNVTKVTFIPYADKNHDAYTQTAATKFQEFGFQLESLHKSPDPAADILKAQAIFIGGGNTFLLLKTLYDNKLIEPIRQQVLNGVPYMGSSAGTNVACVNICTTNDMPIIYPPSFDALKLLPFNINPHYVDPDPEPSSMSETRDKRIAEYHEIPGRPAVVGLREGALLFVDGGKITLKGTVGAKVFWAHREPEEYADGADLSLLLKQ